MVKFPQEEQGRMRKLSHPWHGPYRVIERNDPQHPSVKGFEPILWVYQQNVYESHTKSIPQVVLVGRNRFSLGVLVYCLPAGSKLSTLLDLGISMQIQKCNLIPRLTPSLAVCDRKGGNNTGKQGYKCALEI